MSIFKFYTIVAAGILTANTFANPEGKQVYQQLCTACHGANGEGAGNGAFPPLAESEWLKGDASRVAQILLHGLTGPVEVKGKTYNLMMPPQGNLTEQQSVDVINYVVSKWGEQKKPFTMAEFKKASDQSASRSEPWTADELLKLYPIPGQKANKTHLTNLIKYMYHGNWKEMPDFSKLESNAVEEEHDGILSLEKINRKEHFALVWEGELEITEAGIYQFQLQADDSAALIINKEQIVAVEGLGVMHKRRMKSGSADLKAGLNDFRFEFMQNERDQGINLRFRKKGEKTWNMLTKSKTKKKSQKYPEIDLTPSASDRVRIYNNFIEGSSARGLAVGFPEGNHYAYSTDTATLDLLWSGKFISGGRHWTNRGQGFQAPSENKLLSISEKKPSWSTNNNQAEIDYKGYKLNEIGNPTFHYLINGAEIKDSFVSTDYGIQRSIQIVSAPQSSTILTLAENFSGKLTPTEAIVSKNFSISIQESSTTLEKKQNQLVLTIPSTPSTLTIDYKWKN